MPEPEAVLITGAAGFLGTWLADAAHRHGLAVIGVDIVAPRRPDIWSAFAMQSCDHADYAALVGSTRLRTVFHLAGGASVPESVKNPAADFAGLLPGTVELLVFLAHAQRDAHLVLFSSAAVYGNPSHLPIAETAPIAPISPYGVHKAAAEFVVEHYARLFGLRASLLRLFSAYGEGQRKQIVWDLCQKGLVAQRDGGAVPLHGTGDETRDFIHASDVASAALLVAQRPPESGTQVLNVACGAQISVRTLAEQVMAEVGCQADLEFNGVRRAGDPAHWQADTSRLRALGFGPSVAFGDGIARCVSWQRQLHTRLTP